MSAAALKQVESALTEMSGFKPKKDFFRHSLSVPSVRKHLKAGFSFTADSSPAKDLQNWDYIWKNAKSFDAMSMALYFYQHRSLTKKEYLKIKTWINRCTCWEHSDDLSKIYAQVVEEHPEWIVKDLRTWNKSKFLWKRRQSVVSLLEYASKRNRTLPFDELISFVKNLLLDEEYYVQKGLGWTLREIYNVYPAKTLKFINNNLALIAPTAYSAATEKIEKPVKRELNQKRKLLRSNVKNGSKN